MQKKSIRDLISNLSKRSLLRIYFGIIVALWVICLENIFRLYFSAHTVAGALALGIILGALIARIDMIAWHEDMMQVVRFINVIGVFLLFTSVIFVLFRQQIILWYLPSAPIASLVIPLFVGFMMGRFFGIGEQSFSLLNKESVFKS